MKIATWNVNSVKARLDTVRTWLAQAAPDIAGFQEIKTTDDQFPTDAFEGLGYNSVVHGQKSYNGVAILSKRPPRTSSEVFRMVMATITPATSKLLFRRIAAAWCV